MATGAYRPTLATSIVSAHDVFSRHNQPIESRICFASSGIDSSPPSRSRKFGSSLFTLSDVVVVLFTPSLQIRQQWRE
jgi:hypothetical protein